jgi:hypothetical protein
MEHVICFNTNSFPASTDEHAYKLLLDAIHGVLELNLGSDKFIFCLDSNGSLLSDLSLSEGFLYSDFIERTKNEDRDLYTFLLDVEDRSPVLDSLTADELDDITKFTFYAKNQAVTGKDSTDIYSIAWFLSATLLSLNTKDVWNSNKVEICRILDDGKYIEDEFLFLNNIASQEHGRLIYESFTKQDDIKNVLAGHYFSGELIDWYTELTVENKKRVLDKLTLSCERKFNGGEPLFKNLDDADGLREIRFNAYPGGAIRILFKPQDDKQAILFGFIKKSNTEGYKHAIEKANELYPIKA